MDELDTRPRSRALVLVAALAVATGLVVGVLVALLVPAWLGVLVGLLVAGAVVAAAWWGATPLALSLARVEPADATAHARFHNLVEGLCVAGGVPKPDLGVVADPALNAFVAGRSADSATLAVTTGLLDQLNRVELEAVLAHELSHVRSGDVRAATIAVVVPGLPVALADRWLRPAPGSRAPTSALAPLGRAVLAVATPAVVPLMKAVVGDRRDAAADLAAIEVTRYPPALVSALTKLLGGSTVVASPSRATAHLWLARPLAVDADALGAANARYATQLPLDERIAALDEL